MVLRLAAATVVGLTLVVGPFIVGTANALTGTIAGHGFALSGSVGSVTLGPLNLVTLPPGGGSNVPLGASEPPVAANSASASTTCSGNATGPQVDATCSAEVSGLSLSVSAVEIVTATVIRAQSNSVDAGAGPSSNNVGTLFSGLCIQQTPVGPCTPVSAPGPVSVNLPGVVTGTIDVQVEVPRTMEGAVAGSGLTVTMLHIELTTPLISIVMDIAEADSFVGGVTADTPTPTPPLLRPHRQVLPPPRLLTPRLPLLRRRPRLPTHRLPLRRRCPRLPTHLLRLRRRQTHTYAYAV